MTAPKTPYAELAHAIALLRNARCDELVSRVWVATPERMVIVAHVIVDCIVRTMCSQPHERLPRREWLAALPPLRDASARASARAALSRSPDPSPLDGMALLLLSRLDVIERSPREQFGGLFGRTGQVPLAFANLRRSGVLSEGAIASALGGVIAHQGRTVVAADARALEREACELSDIAASAEAASVFAQAAEAARALHDHDSAFRSLSNAGAMRQLTGELQLALGLYKAALAIPTTIPQRAIAAMNRAALLDRLEHIEAEAAWLAAAELSSSHAMNAFCAAHALGAAMKQGQDRIADLRKLLDRAQLTPSERAGVIGGAGQSAGKRGVPLLAQAVLLCCVDRSAWNTSTLPFWDRLINHVDPTTAPGLALAALGEMLTVMAGETPETKVLCALSRAVLERCARARSMTVDQARDALMPNPQRRVEQAQLAFDNAVKALLAMIPDETRVPLGPPLAPGVN